MSEQLTTQPYKGTKDLMPDDFEIQKYIFNKWAEVCLKFGYKQYLTPLLETADLYRAKSGMLKEELFVLKDRAERELALRPEMTPSVTRMVASIINQSPKPLRLFSIANFFRNEAPQKGRLREFWQLNYDIFGDASINADLEIAMLGIEIMLSFGAPKNSFKLYINNRILLESFLNEYVKSASNKIDVTRIMDKYAKLPEEVFKKELGKLRVDEKDQNNIIRYLNTNNSEFEKEFAEISDSEGYKQIVYLIDKLNELGYSDYFEFKPGIVRGIDYYDGTVFEMFDMNPDNRRSLFGGGRYNGLSDIFGVEPFPATGCAPGNVTMQLFLEGWGLIPQKNDKNIYAPMLSDNKFSEVLKIVNKLRQKGLYIEADYELKSITEALRFANKRNYKYILILGNDELKNNTITIKNLTTGEQKTQDIDSENKLLF